MEKDMDAAASISFLQGAPGKACGNQRNNCGKIIMTPFSNNDIIFTVCVIFKGELSKMAARTTKKKSSKKRTPNKKPNKKQQPNAVYNEIIILTAFAICILLLLSNFGVGGIAGEAVSSVMFGLFGFMAFLMPFILFGVIAFLISNKGNSRAYVKIAAVAVLVLMLAAFGELFTNSYRPGVNLQSFYRQSSMYKNGGGLLGGCIVKIFSPWIGVIGTYVVLVIMIVICMILITGRAMLTPLGKGSKRAYEDARRRHQMALKRREEKRTKQEEANKKKTAGRMALPSENLVINRPETPSLPLEEQFPAVNIGPDTGLSDAGLLKEEQKILTPSEKKPLKQESKKQVQQETAQVDVEIRANEEVPAQSYRIPPLSLLKRGSQTGGDSDTHLRATAMKLEQTLLNFGVKVRVTNASCGPSVTRYELQPEQGVKVSRIVGLADDIKLNLAVPDLRIEAPIPGKAAVGIEVPNSENTAVMLRDLLESNEFKNSQSKISFAVGKDISGKVVVTDIAKMPHLLVAGATGSGKSVCINTLIMSILFKSNPEDVKLIMIDPKVVELSVYNGIPHLMIPVVTDPKKAAGALNWAVAEMTRRYQLFAEYNVRDLKGFNDKIAKLPEEPAEPLPKRMSQIVIIVDELADLMMVAPGEVEGAICRLAQLARAAGLHLILATQRPSVNVITGLIKANMPSRIAFSVSSGVDSRTIIDMNGAEKLLGKGDMLFYPSGYPKPVRVQGSFVSDKEVQKVVDYLIEQNGDSAAAYSEELQEQINSDIGNIPGLPGQMAADENDDNDAYFAEAGKLIIEKEKASIGMLQRMFKIGFNRAARIMDQLHEAGVVSGEEGTKPRKVLMTMEEFEQYLVENK